MTQKSPAEIQLEFDELRKRYFALKDQKERESNSIQKAQNPLVHIHANEYPHREFANTSVDRIVLANAVDKRYSTTQSKKSTEKYPKFLKKYDQGLKPSFVEDFYKSIPPLDYQQLHTPIIKCEERGACQFIAFIRQLQPELNNNDVIRNMAHTLRLNIVEHMTHNADVYNVGIKEQWRQYIENMKLDATWGDDRTIQAFADLYVITVVVVQDENNTVMYVKPSMITTNNTSDHMIWLFYNGYTHYDSCAREVSLNGRKILQSGKPDDVFLNNKRRIDL